MMKEIRKWKGRGGNEKGGGREEKYWKKSDDEEIRARKEKGESMEGERREYGRRKQ